MTAPPVTIVSTMALPGTPTWDIGGGALRIINGSHIDSLGRQWTVAKHPDGEKGWAASPGPRTNRNDRIDAEGSWRSRSYRKERLVTLSGSVLCPDPATRERTETELAALCDPAGGFYTYRRTTDAYDQCIEVELDDDPIIDVVTLCRVDWSFRFAAPDPRKHDYQWQEPRADPPQTGLPAAGIDDTGGGLDDSGGGLDDLAGGVPGIEARPALVGNYGTAPARPFFELRGGATGLTRPRIYRLETGEELRCQSNIAIGETVWINCDQFPARGVPAQMCLSSTRGDVSSLWSVGVTWPEVAAQDVATFALDSTGPREAMTVALRSAYR